MDQVGVYPGIAYGFHHRQVLEIIVRLEEGIAGEEFDKDAPYAPDIARI